jgi:iron complex transport system ATP-binding protein
MLEASGLYAGYGGEDVIRNISFNAGRGECLCILGPNGCGKSTLLKAIARIIGCRGGVKLAGRELASFPRKELAKKLAFLGQAAQVYFPYTVRETVALGRYAYGEGFFKSPSREDDDIISKTMQILEIENIQNRMIDEISGGQLQRVFLAKTLAQNPELILLDEPTNHLDLKNQIDLLMFLKSWVRQNNRTLVSVLHDLNLARQFADTALLMNNGGIAAYGPVEQTLNSETLKAVYGFDVRRFMTDSLEKWRDSGSL